MHNPFQQHLHEAIQINRVRKAWYTIQSKGRSTRLSNRLILLEKALIPLAGWIDRKAIPFQKAGIPILENDFVAMHPLRPVEEIPSYQDRASSTAIRPLLAYLKAYRQSIHPLIKQGKWEDICRETARMLQVLEQKEKELRSHFAMSRHLLESLGWLSLHAIDYARQSQGKTDSLVRLLLKGHARSLKPGLTFIDRAAQKMHQMGIGIIVNDLPEIPFLADWEKWKASG